MEIQILGSRMHPWTMRQTVDQINLRIKTGDFTRHSAINVAKLVAMHKNIALREAVLNCDIISIDGMGVVWGARFLGLEVPERVSGIDLFHELLAMSAKEKYSIYLLGAEPDIVIATVRQVQKHHPGLKVAGFYHGYFWDHEADIVDKIRLSGAYLLFVAISSPKKEIFINRWRDQLGVRFVMGVGGAFDVVAGKVKRAPAWMQKWGLEWLYRVWQEPRRMWKRYLVTNTKFILLLLKEKFNRMGKHENAK